PGPLTWRDDPVGSGDPTGTGNRRSPAEAGSNRQASALPKNVFPAYSSTSPWGMVDLHGWSISG
ncbi:MAG: hypothetical protein KAU91_09165, partial [Candidatus Aminicenantes bacterium]|nr:hypothetical protein [Candidatus Aminicenantes bacterium]